MRASEYYGLPFTVHVDGLKGRAGALAFSEGDGWYAVLAIPFSERDHAEEIAAMFRGRVVGKYMMEDDLQRFDEGGQS